MQTIVYGSTREIAYEQLDEILKDIPIEDIKYIRRNKYDFTVRLNNGNYYIALPANHGARGYKWQYAFIDKTIDKNMIDDVIFSTFIPLNENGMMDSSINIEDRYEWF